MTNQKKYFYGYADLEHRKPPCKLVVCGNSRVKSKWEFKARIQKVFNLNLGTDLVFRRLCFQMAYLAILGFSILPYSSPFHPV